MILWHMSGAGNSFWVMDARKQKEDFSALARALCAQYPADGFMALKASETADFRLDFYNADGSRAAMCGNGLRCICRFAYDNGLAGSAITVQTDAGPTEGQRLAENLYRVRLNEPGEICIGPVSRVTVGVPHALVEVSAQELEWEEALLPRARALRKELDANVNFYHVTGPSTVRVRTYERGVEGFTAACGTGCAAVATLLQAQGRLRGPMTAENTGGTLTLEVSPQGTYLTGPTEVLEILEI